MLLTLQVHSAEHPGNTMYKCVCAEKVFVKPCPQSPIQKPKSRGLRLTLKSKLAQLAVGLAQPAVGLAQPAVGLAQPVVGLSQSAVGLAQPAVELAQPAVELA